MKDAMTDHKAEWPAGVLNREATLKLLREHNEWRRGASTPQTDPRMLGLALDAAIAALTAAPAASDATINSDGIDSKLIGAASEGEWVPVPRELLTDLADDLEAQVLTKGDLPRRIKRDLQPVIRARELLAAAPEPFLSGDGGPVSNASEGEDGAGVAFDSAEALADWLETLHEADGPAVMCGKWEPAQVAARAIREHLTRPAAQVAAAPKHDEGRDFDAWHDAQWPEPGIYHHRVAWRHEKSKKRAAWDAALATQPAARRVSGEGVTVDPSPVRDFPEAHVVRFRVGARVFCIGDVFYTKEAAEKMAEAFRADLESFAQPAARRVTNEDVERACGAAAIAAGEDGWPGDRAKSEIADCRTYMRAALESFAQPADPDPSNRRGRKRRGGASMKTSFQIERPDEIEATITVTMTLKDWRELNRQMTRAWPSWELSEAIDDVVRQATAVEGEG